MRIPHTIPINTVRGYAISEQTLALVGEKFRTLKSEDVIWDDHVPLSLAQICVHVLCEHFETHSEVLPFLPRADLDYLLEVLPVGLSIHIVVPIIEDGIYWQRRCESRWPKLPLDVRNFCDSWRRMYLEKHVEEYIHEQEPGYIDWDDVKKVMETCSPFVVRLNIKELKPPRHLDPLPNPPDECIRGTVDPDHMDLSPVLTNLKNLEALSIRFGVRKCGMKYNPLFFRISLLDIENLSNGLVASCNLTKFRLHRCDINDIKLNIILSALIKCQTLQILEVSHCAFGDIGAKSFGKLIMEHKSLQSLIIENNKFQSEGVLGIAYALKSDTCCPLKLLNLQLNLIGDVGAEYLASSFIKNETLVEVNLSGAGITSLGAAEIADSLLLNSSIRRIILCNNHLDDIAAEHIILTVQSNRRIETFDIRNCNISTKNETTIHKFIAKNRLAYRDV